MSNENEYNYITVESGHYTVEPTQINVMHLFLCSIISNLFFKSFFHKILTRIKLKTLAKKMLMVIIT